jgi:hypothetical protein
MPLLAARTGSCLQRYGTHHRQISQLVAGQSARMRNFEHLYRNHRKGEPLRTRFGRNGDALPSLPCILKGGFRQCASRPPRRPRHAETASLRACLAFPGCMLWRKSMNSIVYIVGLVVIIGAILAFLGFR